MGQNNGMEEEGKEKQSTKEYEAIHYVYFHSQSGMISIASEGGVTHGGYLRDEDALICGVEGVSSVASGSSSDADT